VEHLPRQRYETGAVILSLAVRIEPEGAGLLVSGRIASCQDVEDLGTCAQPVEHTLVVGAGQVWHRDVQARELILRQMYAAAGLQGHSPLPLRLAADSISPPSPLFDGCGVPAEVAMDYVPAMAVKVDRLLPHLRADKDVRQQRRVKANTVEQTVKSWQAVAYFALSPCGRG